MISNMSRVVPLNSVSDYRTLVKQRSWPCVGSTATSLPHEISSLGPVCQDLVPSWHSLTDIYSLSLEVGSASARCPGTYSPDATWPAPGTRRWCWFDIIDLFIYLYKCRTSPYFQHNLPVLRHDTVTCVTDDTPASAHPILLATERRHHVCIAIWNWKRIAYFTYSQRS